VRKYRELEEYHDELARDAEKAGKKELERFYRALSATEWWIRSEYLEPILERCRARDLEGTCSGLRELRESIARSIPWHMSRAFRERGFRGAHHLVSASVDMSLAHDVSRLLEKCEGRARGAKVGID